MKQPLLSRAMLLIVLLAGVTNMLAFGTIPMVRANSLQEDPFEPNNSWEEARIISTNTMYNNLTIHNISDVDYFNVTNIDSKFVVHLSYTTNNTVINIYRNALWIGALSFPSNKYLVIDASWTDVFTLVVSGLVASYSFEVIADDMYEENDDPSNARNITHSGFLSNLRVFDDDWFVRNFPNTTKYVEIDVQAIDYIRSDYTWGYLYLYFGTPGNLTFLYSTGINSAYEYGWFNTYDCLGEGDLYILVNSTRPISNLTFQIQFYEDFYEPNNDPSSAILLNYNMPYQKLISIDEDWYKLPASSSIQVFNLTISSISWFGSDIEVYHGITPENLTYIKTYYSTIHFYGLVIFNNGNFNSGFYYIRVNPQSPFLVTMQISNQLQDDIYENNNLRQNAYDLGVFGDSGGLSVEGILLDDDWFKFHIPRENMILSIILFMTESIGLQVQLTNSTGHLLYTASRFFYEESGDFYYFNYSIYQSGDYYIRIKSILAQYTSYTLVLADYQISKIMDMQIPYGSLGESLVFNVISKSGLSFYYRFEVYLDSSLYFNSSICQISYPWFNATHYVPLEDIQEKRYNLTLKLYAKIMGFEDVNLSISWAELSQTVKLTVGNPPPDPEPQPQPQPDPTPEPQPDVPNGINGYPFLMLSMASLIGLIMVLKSKKRLKIRV